MVVTRGFIFPQITFAMSTLRDKDLWFENNEPLEQASKHWKKYFEGKKISVQSVHFMNQVHGKDHAEVDDTTPLVLENLDALITNKRGHFLAVKSADCLPVMLFDPKRNVVAAVHSGWKGTKEKIVEHVVQKLLQEGSKKEDTHTILCPCIGSCCYDVTGADDGRIETFEKLFGTHGVKQRNGKIYLDLRGANMFLLEQMGILKDNIVSLDECTSCGVMDLPSYFKDKTTKRFISVIGIA